MAARIIPVVMAVGALSEAAAEAASAAARHADARGHDEDPSRPLSGPAMGRSPSVAEAMDGRERPPVFVRVAGEPIDEAEIAREMQFHRATDPHASRQAAVRTLVVSALVRRECARLEITAMPVDGETEDEALVRQLLEQVIETPRADAAAIARYHEANRQRLHTPDRLRVRHVLLAAAPVDIKARQRAQQLGEELIAALRDAPERFVEFAMRHSVCPSRDQGGELGWLERGDTVPEFDRQLFMLKPGLAGLTVETRYGHHVVELIEREEGRRLALDEARERIAAYLETQAQQNAVHQYLLSLADYHGVTGLEGDTTPA